VRLIVAPSAPILEIDAADHRRFVGGGMLSRYWLNLCNALDSHYHLLLSTGEPEPTTARPKHLRAAITATTETQPLRLREGERMSLGVVVANVGDTVWLPQPDSSGRGWTRLGVHLYQVPGKLLDYDWLRCDLPQRVAPGESVDVSLSLPSFPAAGRYEIAVDLVVEGLTWFGERESKPLFLTCEVS
jgi:hypothetical protein